MPYADKEKRKQIVRNHFLNNRAACNKRAADNKHRLREWFKQYKSTLCCSRCPENYPACLDFHHEDGDDKKFTVSYMVGRGYKIERILEEIAKCIVLCANCHRKLHDKNEG